MGGSELTMILSMTGYGQGQFSCEDFVLTLVLKSVNHRHFDVNLRIPQDLQSFENMLKTALKERLVRGSVSATVLFENTSEIAVRVNDALAGAYLRAARGIQEKFQLNSELNVDSLLRLPNVVVFGNSDMMGDERSKEKYASALQEALRRATEELTAMRRLEGGQLENDLRERTAAIGSHVETIEKALQSSVQTIYEKLKEDVIRLTQSVNVDPARLAQEVAYLAEKSDVTEEVTRLKSHVKQFLDLLSGSGEIGKKLDFLLQEMNREANTILSKTSSVFGEARKASDIAIEIKSEIEKLREQAQNVL